MRIFNPKTVVQYDYMTYSIYIHICTYVCIRYDDLPYFLKLLQLFLPWLQLGQTFSRHPKDSKGLSPEQIIVIMQCF